MPSSANSPSVQFLIVGGYAVAAHGHPRSTKDLDVWVLVDPENKRASGRPQDLADLAALGDPDA